MDAPLMWHWFFKELQWPEENLNFAHEFANFKQVKSIIQELTIYLVVNDRHILLEFY